MVFPYGIREIKIISADDSQVASLPASQKLDFSERFASAERNNYEGLVGVNTLLEAVEWSLEAGGISLDAHALLMGAAVDVAGSTPNVRRSIRRRALDAMPYVKIYGRAVGDAGDAVHVLLFRCQVTSMEGSLAGQSFYVTSCSGLAIPDTAGDIWEVIELETDAVLL